MVLLVNELTWRNYRCETRERSDEEELFLACLLACLYNWVLSSLVHRKTVFATWDAPISEN